MTRNDYEILARAIATAYTDLQPVGAATDVDAERVALYNRVGARAVARRVADALGAQNARFNRARFLAACGMSTDGENARGAR